MTAPEKIRRWIVEESAASCDIKLPPLSTICEVNDTWVALEIHPECGDDCLSEMRNELRGGYDCMTDVPSPSSRHYEAKSVAAKMSDGTWVGWTYWYGGGKHGEPEAIDWIEDAYDLDCIETQEMVTVRKWAVRKAKGWTT